MTLFVGVAAGLVEGTTAPTTPTGRANSVTPVSGSSLTTPVVATPAISRSKPSVLRWFLRILSGTRPSPVASTAICESAAFLSGSIKAQAAAKAARSSKAWSASLSNRS